MYIQKTTTHTTSKYQNTQEKHTKHMSENLRK